MAKRFYDAVFLLLATSSTFAADLPQLADAKQEIISRCRKQMEQYGASLIKACVDQDLEALEALHSYPPEDSKIIDRCVRQMKSYGYSLVKACADQDIAAEKALKKY
jgi:hypothetical protein